MAHTFMKINAFFRFIKHEFANWQGCMVIPRNVLYATYSNWSWSWFDSLYPPRLQRAAFVFFMFCSKGHASMNERGDRIICLSPCIVWSCGKFQVITEITITHRQQQPRLSSTADTSKLLPASHRRRRKLSRLKLPMLQPIPWWTTSQSEMKQ